MVPVFALSSLHQVLVDPQQSVDGSFFNIGTLEVLDCLLIGFFFPNCIKANGKETRQSSPAFISV
jgi:hypothetical protein